MKFVFPEFPIMLWLLFVSDMLLASLGSRKPCSYTTRSTWLPFRCLPSPSHASACGVLLVYINIDPSYFQSVRGGMNPRGPEQRVIFEIISRRTFTVCCSCASDLRPFPSIFNSGKLPSIVVCFTFRVRGPATQI